MQNRGTLHQYQMKKYKNRNVRKYKQFLRKTDDQIYVRHLGLRNAVAIFPPFPSQRNTLIFSMFKFAIEVFVYLNHILNLECNKRLHYHQIL